jgi:orotate phosphoribosyltransferase
LKSRSRHAKTGGHIADAVRRRMNQTPRLDLAKRTRLKALIAARSVLTGGDFRLASGGRSTVFFDMKMTLLDPEGLNLVADLMLQLLEHEKFDAIGGLVLGACPIVDAITLKAFPARRISGFYVRKEGSSVLKAVHEARAIGCTVATVVTCVDRQQGARERLAGEGIALKPIFTMDEFN